MTQRTDQQRKAIEVFCRELAEALNDAGYEMKAFFEAASDKADIPWTQESVKEILWKNVQKPVTISEEFPEGKKSTKQLDIMEVDRVYSVLDRHVSSSVGVHVEFPSEERMMFESSMKRSPA